MSAGTLLRLALAGTRTDALRVLLTAASAALATLFLLAAATVLAIPGLWNANLGSQGWAGQYRHALLQEPGLRPGVALSLVLLTIPVLALAGQCARLGAPARDRRLAVIRLAGATPRQALWVAAAETGVASVLGSAAGLATYLIGRVLLHRPDRRGQLLMPTDVAPAAWAMAAICAGLPLLAMLVAGVLLRRVTVSPLGVLRQASRVRSPRPWPGLLIVLGVAAFAALEPIGRFEGSRGQAMPPWLVPTLLFGGGMVAALGVVLGAGWISYTAGRVLHRLARRPAALVAARRLMADPWAGSRVLAALLVGALFGGGAAAVRADFRTEMELRARAQRRTDELLGQDSSDLEGVIDSFYLSSMDLVDLAVWVALTIAAMGLLVALAEGIVARRRAYASLVATGVPRRMLARSIIWQGLAPAVPAIGVALGVGVALTRSVFHEATSGGGSMSYCDATAEVCADPAQYEAHLRTVEFPEVTVAIPVPWEQLAWLGTGTVAVLLAVTGVGLLFLRAATAPEELRTT